MEGNQNVFSVNMFGGLTFYYGKQRFSLQCSNTSKVMQLFLMILLSGKEGISKSCLTGGLYGADEMQDTKNALRILIFRLRKLLKETLLPDGEYIEVLKGVYRFCAPFSVWIDAKAFEENVQKSKNLPDQEEALELVKQACSQYKGELLPSLFDGEWIENERKRYKDLYVDCMNRCCSLLAERRRYPELIELCDQAIRLYPFGEWLFVKMDGLLAMERNKEAMKLYESTSALFFEKQESFPTEKILERFQALGSQIHYAMGTLADIKNTLTEKEYAAGAYYCSYPSFMDSYRIITRMMERSGQSVFLMLCTLTDNKGNPLEKDEALFTCSEYLCHAIGSALRRGDLFTCHGPGQFLILLSGIKQEECELAYQRIWKSLKEKCKGQRIRLSYYVSSAVQVKGIGRKLHFKTSQRWETT